MNPSFDGSLERLESLFATEQWAESTSFAQRLIEGLTDATQLLEVGRLAQRNGAFEAALAAYNKSLSVEPQSSLANLLLGTLFLDIGQYGNAIQILSRSQQLDSANAVCCFFLAQAYLKVDEVENARLNFCRAISLDSEYEEAYLHLGILLRDSDPNESKELLVKAVELDTASNAAKRELAHVLIRLGDRDYAERLVRELHSNDPADAWALVYLGTLEWWKGNLQAARSCFMKAIDAQPDEGFPLWSLGNLLEFEGESSLAKSYYEAALRRDPESIVAIDKLLAQQRRPLM